MTSERVARTLALLVVALGIGLTIRYNTFAAWGTDSGAYISAGYAWARGDLFTPATFVNWAPWAAEGQQLEFPVGHVQGPIKGTITSQYPLGYPLLIAAALRIVEHPLTPHLVSPLLLGVLAWCGFVLGRQMVSGWAGVLAALLITSTPIVLSHAVIPFSDVPAAAFWALAWVMSVRAGFGAAMASGAASAMAVMIRPNLAPLAIVIAATVCFSERRTWAYALKRLVAFGVVGVLGPLCVLWSQAALYGHPLQSGYRVPMDYFFSLDRVPYNAGLYPRMLAELHTWLVFGGLLYTPFAVRQMRTGDAGYTKGLIAISALGVILVSYALYLPYLTYVGWYWLRFLLPALFALFLLLAAAVDELRVRLHSRWPRIAFVALVPALVVAWAAAEHIRPPVGYERIQMAERFFREIVPDDAVILTFTHGGAWTLATGRPTLRLDLMAPDALDRIVRDLRRRGHRPVFVFDAAVEGEFFAHRYRSAALGRLTWPARAEIASTTSVLYYDITDRDVFFSGDRWPTDVVVEGRTTRGHVAWSDMRSEHERIVLPLAEETMAFRSALDAVYRDRLARPAQMADLDAAVFLRWFRRYLRLRLHACGHDAAEARVLQQIADHTVPPLCGRPDDVRFPPEDESMAFRRRLAGQVSDHARKQPATHVDALGEVVWTQRYLDARVRGCSHENAIARVVAEITGAADVPCAPRTSHRGAEHAERVTEEATSGHRAFERAARCHRSANSAPSLAFSVRSVPLWLVRRRD